MALDKSKQITKFENGIISLAEAEPHVKVLLYGRNGQGKTRIAATAPKPLLLDVNERGTQSVRNYPGFMRRIDRWEDLTYAYWYLREGNHNFESVILDTLTMAQNMCMRHVLKEAEDRDPNREPSMPDRRTWGKMGELMKPLMLNFRNLDMNVIFVAQERVMGDPDSDDVLEHVPDLSPNPRGFATASVGIIGRVYQKKVRTIDKKTKKETEVWETRMLVGPHDEYTTKDRTGQLGRIVRNPTVPMMIEAAQASLEEA